MPIFVPFDSVEVWINKELFYLDEYGNPIYVAGVPPDYFSETGQLWGNPVYRWDLMEKNNFKWWKKRIKYHTYPDKRNREHTCSNNHTVPIPPCVLGPFQFPDLYIL